MSWIQKLYETYNNCEKMVGVGADDNEVSLLPICHTTQKAQIEIVLDQAGIFKKARVIPKNEARTIIPCTESSSGRTSGESPHPLCDKLQYVASDYNKYGGNRDSYFQSYVSLLADWIDSKKNEKVKIVYDYIKRGSLVHDLIELKILFLGEDGKLLKQRNVKKENRESLDIFDLLPGRINKKGEIENWQADSFIRWVVEIPNEPQSSVWNDPEIWENWIRYYSHTKQNKTLCYVTGENVFSAEQHPSKLRSDGDKAKIISSNDLSGFTFRGRFLTASQAANVGFEVTQKAHSALRWLIGCQGYKGKDGQAIVAWATSGAEIPKPTDDPLAILGFDELPSDQSKTVSTAQDLALKLKKKIAGYNKEIGDTTNIVVMGLDAATPGRMSITFYKELGGSDFLQRIDDWHATCAWIHRYGYDKETKRHFTFVGAPAPVDIAEAAFGKKADDKIKKATVARILPCIIDKQPIPRDIVESAVRRVCNRITLDDWEWNKTLSITCALFKKYNTKENYNMALEENRKNRDYLYGRLLAIADRLEGSALHKAKEKRDTNAARYMQLFAEHPHKTWRQIELSLAPYKARLGGAHYFTGLIDEVMCKFGSEDFINDKPLSGEFLLGYHCQRAKLWEKIKDEEPEENQDEAQS
ncbi:MAG: type I-C CRISPR-associated protein Cas8c/Csd1 [Ignavibacteriaceae bacterium]